MTAALRTSTLGMSREEWLAARATGIGSSDAAVAAGMNPYKSAFKLWEEKLGLVEPDDLSQNEAVHWGTVLEPVVAAEFARRTGRKVRRVNAILRNPEHPFMLANLDYEVAAADGGEPEILECKTAGWRATFSEEWGEGVDSIPAAYYVQVLHQMAVRGRGRAHLAVLMAGQDFRMYTIERDDVAIAQLIKLEASFWKCVETKVAPSIISVADALRAFPQSKAALIEATDEIISLSDEFRNLNLRKKELDERLESVKGRIGAFMGENDTLVDIGGKPILTWKTQHRRAYSVAESSTRVFRFAKGGSQ